MEIQSPAKPKRIFPLASVYSLALGPPSLLSNRYPGVLSPGGKAQPRRDADNQSPSSADAANE
jgi:hypothetical protein